MMTINNTNDWSDVIPKIERCTLKVSTDFGEGTGFIIHYYDKIITIATAWHVIKELSEIEDKHARGIELYWASGSTKINANAVGIARLGPEKYDVGIVWVGNPFSEEQVDDILQALAKSGIEGGYLDLSGGGKVIDIIGQGLVISQAELPNFLHPESVEKGMEIGWLGYPTFAEESTCFFLGTISGYLDSKLAYLVDGTPLPAISGSPVFDSSGRILGIISVYYEPDELTMNSLLCVVPVAPIVAALKTLSQGVSQEGNLILQSYYTVCLLAELSKKDNLINSRYFQDLKFDAPFIKDGIREIGVGNRGSMLMALYAMLVIPKELIYEKYSDKFDELNLSLISYARDIKNKGYYKEGKTYKLLRHIRNAVAHARVTFTRDDMVIFEDENPRNKSYFSVSISLRNVEHLIFELQKIHIQYIQDNQTKSKTN